MNDSVLYISPLFAGFDHICRVSYSPLFAGFDHIYRVSYSGYMDLSKTIVRANRG